jgi:uncharacterized membrane protein YgdD (TMEM256/DUF423 family)
MKGPQEVHQWSKVGAFLGMTAVALGAYGAHGLKATPKLVDSWKTAAQVRLTSSPHVVSALRPVVRIERPWEVQP